MQCPAVMIQRTRANMPHYLDLNCQGLVFET